MISKAVFHYSLFPLVPLFTLAAGPVQAGQKNPSPGPNILVILVDDYGWTDCGFMGSRVYETPNIDRLAAMGTVFTDGYAACQVSSPSRASIMTGLYTTRHGVTDWIGEKSGAEWRSMGRCTKMLPADYRRQLDEDFTTIAEALKGCGYTTFIAGKWHLGDNITPQMQGFDINRGGWASGSPKGGYFPPYENPELDDGPAGEILPERLGRETAEFIEDMAGKGTPFFAYLSFYAVHAPIQTTESLWRKYRDKIDSLGFEKGPGFEIDRRQPVRKYQDNPVYAGLIEMMDSGVGIVLDKLEELGLDENTVIFFTGDNGGVVSGDNYSTNLSPLRGGKGRQWEGGIRVPFVLYDPQAGNGQVCRTPVSGIDIFPTAMDYAGITDCSDVDGISIRPLVEGRNIVERPLFWHYPHYGNQGGEPSSIIRKGEWKLIFYHESGKYELYNLTLDISETTPLNDRYPDMTAELKKELHEWLDDTDAVMPVPDPLYDEEREKSYRERSDASVLKKQEKLRQDMMKKDWRPDPEWWGSQPSVID